MPPLVQAAFNLGLQEHELQAVVDAFDINGDGRVSHAEFLKVMGGYQSPQSPGAGARVPKGRPRTAERGLRDDGPTSRQTEPDPNPPARAHGHKGLPSPSHAEGPSASAARSLACSHSSTASCPACQQNWPPTRMNGQRPVHMHDGNSVASSITHSSADSRSRTPPPAQESPPPPDGYRFPEVPEVR